MRIALFITEDWYVRSHRLALIEGAVASGHEVVLFTHVDKHRQELEKAGATVLPVPLVRSASKPLGETAAVVAVINGLRHFRPDVLHNVALKPILYGTAAAAAAHVPAVVNAMAGLGALFTDTPGLRHRTLIQVLTQALICRRSWVLVQNPDDREVVKDLGVSAERIALIRGAGVDTTWFRPVPEPVGEVVIARFFGRLLRDKGIHDLYGAALELRARRASVSVELVGSPDPHNPRCIDQPTLGAWRAGGVARFHGQVDDVRPFIEGSNIVVLPSYREGLPKALLEGAAVGRALVATDVPGCREVVVHGKNGLLVPPRNAYALADALQHLATRPKLRSDMGAQSRRMAEEEFDVSLAVAQTLRLYETVITG